MDIEYFRLWEMIHNEYFKHLEFEGVKKEVRLNHFMLSPKEWVEKNDCN